MLNDTTGAELRPETSHMFRFAGRVIVRGANGWVPGWECRRNGFVEAAAFFLGGPEIEFFSVPGQWLRNGMVRMRLIVVRSFNGGFAGGP